MKKVFLTLLMSLFLHTTSYALNGVFWQPQHRDFVITSAQWIKLFAELKRQGVDTLVLQWARYGESFSEKDREALIGTLQLASAQDLRIILGLYADPEFFELQKQSRTTLPTYLTQLTALDLKEFRQWLNSSNIKVDGWYISAEIDDLNWRDVESQRVLLHWLGALQQSISVESSAPIYISSFFAGHMAPQAYRELLESIKGLGLNVWVQDGSGIDRLSWTERQLYLNELELCKDNSAAQGLVYEIFQQQPSEDDSFKAIPKSTKQIVALLRGATSCAIDRLYFSLRYLQNINNPLQYK